MVIQVIASAMPFIAIYQALDGISLWIDGTLVALGRSVRVIIAVSMLKRLTTGTQAAFPILKARFVHNYIQFQLFCILLTLFLYVAQTVQSVRVGASTSFTFSRLFIGIPLGIYLAFVLKWNLAGLWGGLVASSVYSFLIGLAMLARACHRPIAIPALLMHSDSGAQNA